MFGSYCLFAAVLSVVVFFKTDDNGFRIFAAIIGGLHLVTALGISLRTSWGFYVLKAYLYVLLIGFPVGTLVARYLLRYIRENNINQYFGRNFMEFE